VRKHGMAAAQIDFYSHRLFLLRLTVRIVGFFVIILASTGEFTRFGFMLILLLIEPFVIAAILLLTSLESLISKIGPIFKYIGTLLTSVGCLFILPLVQQSPQPMTTERLWDAVWNNLSICLSLGWLTTGLLITKKRPSVVPRSGPTPS